MTKTYDFHLPVFKQGDDLGYCVNHSASVAEALREQAKSYDLAADLCRQMAVQADLYPDLDIDADTHCIFVTGLTDQQAAPLLASGLLQRDLLEEEEESSDPLDSSEDDSSQEGT